MKHFTLLICAWQLVYIPFAFSFLVECRMINKFTFEFTKMCKRILFNKSNILILCR